MLDKSIHHKKEKRKPYYRRGKYCLSCRPNGGCPYCLSDRMHNNKKREQKANDCQNDSGADELP